MEMRGTLNLQQLIELSFAITSDPKPNDPVFPQGSQPIWSLSFWVLWHWLWQELPVGTARILRELTLVLQEATTDFGPWKIPWASVNFGMFYFSATIWEDTSRLPELFPWRPCYWDLDFWLRQRKHRSIIYFPGWLDWNSWYSFCCPLLRRPSSMYGLSSFPWHMWSSSWLCDISLSTQYHGESLQGEAASLEYCTLFVDSFAFWLW